MAIWFTSDTHFKAERTLKLSRRPFESVAEMDAVMIYNWNKLVKEDDTVIHLGDFGDYNVSNILNGNIALIKGNYEEADPDFESKIALTDITVLGERVSFNIGGQTVLCSHKPTDAKKLLEATKCAHVKYALFGHIHNLQTIKTYGLNVGVDAHNFMPLSEESVAFFLGGIENHYDKDVFE